MSINQTMVWNNSTNLSCCLNKTRIPGETKQMSYPCGYCDIHCIYRAINCIFTVGIIANAIVIFRVARDRKLRNATFVCIAACAFADMCFLIVDLAVSYEAVILTITCNYPSRLRKISHRAMRIVAWFTANGHVALLAVVRFVILVYPLKANVYLSPLRVLLLSGLLWVLACLISAAMGLFSFITGSSPGASYQFHLILWTTVYLTPVLTTATLHLVKVYKMRQPTTVTTNEDAKRRVQAMSKMVLLVIFIAAVLPFPMVLNRILRSIWNEIYGSTTVSLQVEYIAHLLVLLNHSINPVMYAFVSKPFRISLKRMLGFDQNPPNGQQ